MTLAAVELVYPDRQHVELPAPRRAFSTDRKLQKELQLAREYMVEQMLKDIKAHPEANLYELADIGWKRYSPWWTRKVSPIILSAFERGQDLVAEGKVPEKILVPLADQYAEQMGQYFNQSSAEAMQEGFNAYINKKVPRRVAAERAVRKFGLTRRQFRSAVAAESDALGEKAVDSVLALDPRRRIADFVLRQLDQRFVLFDTEEMFRATEHGKQLVWLYQYKAGRLPPGTRRMWVTAEDEKVCPRCGPMNHLRAPIDEPFKAPGGGEIWTPSMHVNCRCHVMLWVPTVTLIGKADEPWDDEPRIPKGKRGGGRWTKSGNGAPPTQAGDAGPPHRPRGSRVTFAEPTPDPFLGQRQEVKPMEEVKPTIAPVVRPTGGVRPVRPVTPVSVTPVQQIQPVGVTPAQLSPVQIAPNQVALQPDERQQLFVQQVASTIAEEVKPERLYRETDSEIPEVIGLPTAMGFSESLSVDHPLAVWDYEGGGKSIYFPRGFNISDIDVVVDESEIDYLAEAYEDAERSSQVDQDIDFTTPVDWMGPYAEFSALLDPREEPDLVHEQQEIRAEVQKLVDAEDEGFNIDFAKFTFEMPGMVAGSDKGLYDGIRRVTMNAGELTSLMHLSPTEDKPPAETFVYVFGDIIGDRDSIQEIGTHYGYYSAKIAAGSRFSVRRTKQIGETVYVYLEPDEPDDPHNIRGG